ncbi:TonB-dependent receptor [Dinghuibacter silviterrae]|uniref:TonB-dependent receptor n=1 Tax=Dinghuibacter silviterrae TaxID=1539049 RepID=A0A4R8DT79_9BACT|nr:TonB-dependent receptor [Dinghuibacter silviterrae]TDX01309.1 TonB-dependent receptor [Dinghuibacter silviterrae]
MSLKGITLITISLLISQLALSQTATIKGSIYDGVSKDAVSGALITIGKINVRKLADERGAFEIKNVPPGEYDIVIESVGYLTITRHYSVKAGEVVRVYEGLAVDTKNLGEVKVIGNFNREEEAGVRNRERVAGNITNMISSQAMVRSPDINAANVLQRMSGITVQRSSGGDEAYAVIRGMEPRYNNTLLNGIKIASPDSKNRFVQLDIIPSDILSAIEISKSLLPDMEGDAIGGTVNLVVKDAPQKTSFKAIGSIGYSQLYFDQRYVTFGKSDIQAHSPIQRNPPGYVTQPGDFSRSNLSFSQEQAPPTGTLGFSFTHRFFHNKVGLVLADNFQNQYYGNISTRATVSPIDMMTSDSLYVTNLTNYNGFTQQLNNGVVAHVDYEFNQHHRISVDNFYLYSYLAASRFSMDTTLVGTGRVGPGTGQVFVDSVSETQHMHVENLKISGVHELTHRFTLNWAAVRQEAASRFPDQADVTTLFLINPNYTKNPSTLDAITRNWQRNDDHEFTGLLNLIYKLRKWEIKAGGLYNTKTRYNSEDDYTLQPTTTNSAGGTGGRPVWTGIYNAQYDVFNTAGTNVYNPQNYKVTETIFAEYAMAQYRSTRWEGGGGVRVENTDNEWADRVRSPTQPSAGSQIYQDVLPSAYLKYKFAYNKNLHLSYFKSISRPNYYEIVDAITPGIDFFTQGNSYLQHSVANNLDLRFEWYPKEEEQLFAGVFYKVIDNPIETQLQSASGGIETYTLTNPGTAHNYGAEVAFTKFWGKFGITGNYTYTHSEVTASQLLYYKANHDPNLKQLDSLHVQVKRPLQGQTDHIANVSLLYKDNRHGFFAQLAYEYQGNTLAKTYIYYNSDYYQKPMNMLAFSLEKDINKHFTVFGKFNNLLNTPNKQYVTSYILATSDIYKATYSIGLRYAH